MALHAADTVWCGIGYRCGPDYLPHSVPMTAHVKDEAEGHGLTAQVGSCLLFRSQKTQTVTQLQQLYPSCQSENKVYENGPVRYLSSAAGTSLSHPDLTLPRYPGPCGAGTHAALLYSFQTIAWSKHKETKNLQERPARYTGVRVLRRLWSACCCSQRTLVRIWSVT